MFCARMRPGLALSLVSIETGHNQLIFNMAVRAEEFEVEAELEETPTRRRKQKARKWRDEEVETLIDLFEQHVCLWDIFCKEYHLKEKRDMAYETMKEELDIPVADIKYKIIGLRSQLSREVAKTNQKKSGQGVEESYKSTWLYWDKLQFLIPVIRAGKSRDSIQTSTDGQDTIQLEDEEENEKENQGIELQTSRAKPSKRRAEQELMSKKQEVLDRCLNVLKEPFHPQEKRQCHFSMYIAEKLANFDGRTRMIAEKRISDILFELELGEHSQSPAYPLQPSQASMQYSSNDCSSGSYMGILQSQTPQYHNF